MVVHVEYFYPCDLEERAKEVVENLLETVDQFVALVDVVESRDLDDPADVVGVHLVIDGPRGQLVPLVGLAPVDGEAQLGVLIRAEVFHITFPSH